MLRERGVWGPFTICNCVPSIVSRRPGFLSRMWQCGSFPRTKCQHVLEVAFGASSPSHCLSLGSLPKRTGSSQSFPRQGILRTKHTEDAEQNPLRRRRDSSRQPRVLRVLQSIRGVPTWSKRENLMTPQSHILV